MRVGSSGNFKNKEDKLSQTQPILFDMCVCGRTHHLIQDLIDYFSIFIINVYYFQLFFIFHFFSIFEPSLTTSLSTSTTYRVGSKRTEGLKNDPCGLPLL